MVIEMKLHALLKKNWLHLHILEVLDNLGIMLPIS